MNKFIVYSGNNPDVIRDALLKRGNWEQIPETAKDAIYHANFIWRPCNFGPTGYQKIDDSQRKNRDFIQVFNHFQDNAGMCTKTGLIRTLRQYYLYNEEARTSKYQIWDTTPTSFIISAGSDDIEYQQLINRIKDISKRIFQRESLPAKHCMENMWLVKPANLNQGRGIEVFRSLSNIMHFLSMKPHNSQWVVQKYVEKPLLYHKRKFDIRVWVLVTQKNEVFFYKHGYMRTSSSSYDTKEQNNYVHLTNNCLQQHGDNYGAFEEGNTLSFKTLEDYLRQEYSKYDINLETQIIARFKDFIIDSYLAWKTKLNPFRRKNVFELFGYDFLIDEDLRVWLIEVNTNPYLGVPNLFIADLLPKMVDDMFEIVLDPIFPPKNPVRADGRSNDFELIYGEGGTANCPKPVNVRSPFNKSPYPIIELNPASRIVEYTGNQEMKPFWENEAQEQARSSSIDDSDLINSHISRINSSLLIWSQLSPREVDLACQALTALSNSPASLILADQKHILNMSQLLSIRDVKPEIKITVIEAFNNLIRDIVIKKKILCNKLIHDLINIAIGACDEKECDKSTHRLRLTALRALGNVGGMMNKKTYIPGESRENEKIRQFFISQGGLLALLVISKKGIDEEIRKTAEKCIYGSVELSDWQQQLAILLTFKQFQEEKKRNLITDFIRELKTVTLTTSAETPELQNSTLIKQDNQLIAPEESGEKNSTAAQTIENTANGNNNIERPQEEVQQSQEHVKNYTVQPELVKEQVKEQEQEVKQGLENQNSSEENPNQANFEESKSVKPEGKEIVDAQADPKAEEKPSDFVLVTAQFQENESTHQVTKAPAAERIEIEQAEEQNQPEETKIEEKTPINVESKSVTRDYFIFYRTGQAITNSEKFFNQMITLPQ